MKKKIHRNFFFLDSGLFWWSSLILADLQIFITRKWRGMVGNAGGLHNCILIRQLGSGLWTADCGSGQVQAEQCGVQLDARSGLLASQPDRLPAWLPEYTAWTLSPCTQQVQRHACTNSITPLSGYSKRSVKLQIRGNQSVKSPIWKIQVEIENGHFKWELGNGQLKINSENSKQTTKSEN